MDLDNTFIKADTFWIRRAIISRARRLRLSAAGEGLERVGRLVTPGGNGSLSRQRTGPLQHGRRACVFIIKCFKGNGIAEYISDETT